MSQLGLGGVKTQRRPRAQTRTPSLEAARPLSPAADMTPLWPLGSNLPDSDIGRIVQSPPRQAGAASAKLEAERLGGVTPDASCPSQGKLNAISSAWQIGTTGRDDDKLLAVQHVSHRRARRVAGKRHFANDLAGRLVVGARVLGRGSRSCPAVTPLRPDARSILSSRWVLPSCPTMSSVFVRSK